MTSPYRIYGVELSPYSVKVRSYFRYKGIPHQWITRNAATQADYQKHAKLPIIPLVVTPEGDAIQDSTPILERIEAAHPEPGIHPPDAVTRFISVLLEEFGDEWGNKWMFHYRWAREVDRVCSAGRIARTMMPDASDEQCAGLAQQVQERMVGRVWFVGSNEQNAPQIESSFRVGLDQLEAHLAERPYLFGARPGFGDFGLWGQVYNLWTDPTPCALVEGRAPHVLAWIQRMLWPRDEGPFEPWSALEPTLRPFLETQVGARFLPWSVANAAAIADGKEEFEVELDGQTWSQKPQKYHAKTLKALREKYATAGAGEALDRVLEETGCLTGLRA